MPDPQVAGDVADQGVAAPTGQDAGTESDAATDVLKAGPAGQDTGTEEPVWKPTWRQEQAANRSGLSAEDVAAFVETRGEEWTSAHLDTRADQHDDISRQATQFNPQATAQPGARASSSEREVDVGGVPEGEFALSPELLDKSWEQPAVVAEFMKPVVAELNTMRKAFRTLMGQVQEAGDRATAMTADTFFAGLGDDYADVFGKGPTNVRSMEPHQQARLQVIRSAEKIAEGFRKAGTPIHSQEALERALSMEMGAKLGTLARNRTVARAQKRAGQTQAGPRGRRQTKPVTREDRKAAFDRGAEKIVAGEPYNRGGKP